MRTKEQEIEHCTELGKQEILGLMADKTVPYDARSFSELHDYVDANMLADSERLLDLYDLDGSVDMLNEIQGRLNAWLHGRHAEKAESRPRGTV